MISTAKIGSGGRGTPRPPEHNERPAQRGTLVARRGSAHLGGVWVQLPASPNVLPQSSQGGMVLDNLITQTAYPGPQTPPRMSKLRTPGLQPQTDQPAGGAARSPGAFAPAAPRRPAPTGAGGWSTGSTRRQPCGSARTVRGPPNSAEARPRSWWLSLDAAPSGAGHQLSQRGPARRRGGW